MKPIMVGTMVSILLMPAVILVSSDAWSGCSVEQRIELGKQGYDKGEVEKACGNSGDDFWDILSRGVATGLANGLTNELNQALGGREKSNGASSATSGARACATTAGMCPLSGGPLGYPCYCQAWNGATFTGLSQ